MFHVPCSMSFDIITFGSATRDVLVKPKQVSVLKYEKTTATSQVCFPFGSKIDVDDMQFNSGGGGTNTAATFAMQGFKTAFCGTVGTDLAGQEIINELKKLGVNTSLVGKTNKKITNHSMVILGQGNERTILAYRGASELMDEKTIPWGKLKTKWLYLAPLSGLFCLPRSESADSTTGATSLFENILDFARENNIKVAVNPGIAQLSLPHFADIAKKISVLILNQEEASFLTKIPFQHEKEIFAAIGRMCPGIVIMTKGAEGVLVSDGKHMYSAVPPKERKVVDTTGAGDAFASGFLSEFMRSANIEASIQLGMGNSVGNLSEIGAKTGLLKKGQEFVRVEVMKQ